MVVAAQDLAPQTPAAASGVVLGLTTGVAGALYIALGKLQEIIGLLEGMTVGLAMVIPAAAIALAVLLRHPQAAGGALTRPIRPVAAPPGGSGERDDACGWLDTSCGGGSSETRRSFAGGACTHLCSSHQVGSEAIGTSQRGGRNPASVTVTSRQTAALDGRLPAAPRAWTQ
jgi:hypothetical protein